MSALSTRFVFFFLIFAGAVASFSKCLVSRSKRRTVDILGDVEASQHHDGFVRPVPTPCHKRRVMH